MPKLDKKNWAKNVLETLEARFPEKDFPLHFSSAWELLVATQLSAQCTDQRVNETTPEFFRRWPTPATLLTASCDEVEKVIHATGFFHNKARNLLACAKCLVEKHDGEVPDTMEELLELPGVARKTANVVLYGAFGINKGIAVDTHVKRISHRLGFTCSQEPAKIEKDLMAVFPANSWGKVNLGMVHFGRETCKARKPLCETCPFSADCPRSEPPKNKAG